MGKNTLLALVLCCLTMGAYFPVCARMMHRSQDSLPRTADAQFNRGREIFSELGCYACHVREGRGGASGPDLDAVAAAADPARVIEAIRNPVQTPSEKFGGAIMPAGLADALAEEDFAALVHYLTHAAPGAE